MTEEYDYKDDELITIRLPRKDYEILKDIVEREKTFTNIGKYLRSSYVWIIGGGILSVILYYEQLKGYLIGVK